MKYYPFYYTHSEYELSVRYYLLFFHYQIFQINYYEHLIEFILSLFFKCYMFFSILKLKLLKNTIEIFDVIHGKLL